MIKDTGKIKFWCVLMDEQENRATLDPLLIHLVDEVRKCGLFFDSFYPAVVCPIANVKPGFQRR